MQCPNCGARTQVSETRGSFRDRRCTNTACGLVFATFEHVVRSGACARTRAAQVEASSRAGAGATGQPSARQFLPAGKG